MESIQNLKRRLKGVRNISQITKAMELVAATKMRKSQEVALRSRPYSFAALEFLALLSRIKEGKLPALLTERKTVKKTLFLIIASDKGLAGSFNAAVLRKFEAFVKSQSIDIKSGSYCFAAVGQKAKTYLERRGFKLLKSFTRFGDFTKLEEIKPLANMMVNGYLSGEFDRILAFSMNFKSALAQEAAVRQLLPIEYENLKSTASETMPSMGRFSEFAGETSFFSSADEEYLIEPSAEAVLEKLAPYLLTMRIYHIVLEANASEHSARRAAMKKASENADELSRGLTIMYNKTRQAAITTEMVEITSGAEALK